MTLEHLSNTVRSSASNALGQSGGTDYDVAAVIKNFLKVLPSRKITKDEGTTRKIMDAMQAEMDSYNLSSPLLKRIMYLAASLAELAFPGLALEEKKNIALYTWYVVYIDDASLNDNRPFVAFQQRFTLGLPQLDPVLDAYASVLHALCDQYDTLPANFILSATFDYVNATCLEPALEALPPVSGPTLFPGFLRDRTGLGIPYALFVFTRSRGHMLDFASLFQALPDMNFYIAAINDILSFYKEELAGEQGNYIYNRAHAEGKAPLSVLSDTIEELLEASAMVSVALQRTPEALDAWKNFEAGVISWHLEQDRYRLKELDLYSGR
ncbi:Trichodiene synthase [Hypsizygus marmoreus]|uniref:Trichodiene synthase n=1 Tax=Hypsizygus marmoreus TaxID=39966 RepID=A0A369JY09_HYPMA|nr:Trichodiene synthase [Hypsizygus marmoreus]